MKGLTFIFLLWVSLAVCSLAKPAKPESVQGEKLSDSQHYTDSGEHDNTYDHEAFLGKEGADQFKELTPEESRRRLGIIFNKIDTDNDGRIDAEAMATWIKHSLKKYAYDDAKSRMEMQDLDGSGDLTFEEFVNTTYSYMAEDENLDKVFDKTRKITFRQQIELGRRAWGFADVNKDGKLDNDEYATFLHPHDFNHMGEVVLDRHMLNMDDDKSGKISEAEYLRDFYNPDRDGPEAPEWLESERKNFNSGRDKDGDGLLDREEMRSWVIPVNYDPYLSEAQHLLKDTDDDKDGVLTKEEVLNHQDHFVASRTTDFGKQLQNHDEF